MKQNKCKLCGHQWQPRVKNVAECPRCKRYNWNKTKEDDTNDDNTTNESILP